MNKEYKIPEHLKENEKQQLRTLMEIAAEAKLKGLNADETFDLMIERIEGTLPAVAVHKELEAHPEEYGLERVYYNKDEDTWFWTYKDNSTPSPTANIFTLTDTDKSALEAIRAGYQAYCEDYNNNPKGKGRIRTFSDVVQEEAPKLSQAGLERLKDNPDYYGLKNINMQDGRIGSATVGLPGKSLVAGVSNLGGDKQQQSASPTPSPSPTATATTAYEIPKDLTKE